MKKTGQKKILILSGIVQMIDVIETAQRMGLYTIVTDRDPSSPAKKYADKHYNISTSDTEKLAEIARAEGVDGIFNAFDDVNTWNAQALCQELDLPFYATAEQLEICSDKNKFKEYCRAFGAPVIEEYELDDDLSEENLKKLKYPVIIKPVDSYASQGITVCHSPEEVRTGYEKALGFSKLKKVIVERFVDEAYGVQTIYTIQNGNIVLNGVADRFVHKHSEEFPPLPIAMIFSSQHREQYIESVDPYVRKLIEGIGIRNGVVFIQSLFENGSFYIYEMGFRLGGSQLYSIIEKQTGVNQVEMMLALALGENIDHLDMSLYDNGHMPYPSCNLPILLKGGTISEITGIDIIRELPAVIHTAISKSAGDEVRVTGSYTQMFGRFTIVANSTEELHDTISTIYDKLKIVSTEDEDMLLVKYRPIESAVYE
ncbi:hypothetical protein QWY16_17335 [Planococcus shenhongbingii]|uniref:ATP-binding protein n=1 Tax=Planococcus shenhongbingii TaxID=3058398 RepID=UPI00261E4C11|nr:hypothetical protein [Planococcus sp. N016]WKA58240.1 hypothetical protein QWY16_17335 [Planococcus sp. N016]